MDDSSLPLPRRPIRAICAICGLVRLRRMPGRSAVRAEGAELLLRVLCAFVHPERLVPRSPWAPDLSAVALAQAEALVAAGDLAKGEAEGR